MSATSRLAEMFSKTSVGKLVNRDGVENRRRADLPIAVSPSDRSHEAITIRSKNTLHIRRHVSSEEWRSLLSSEEWKNLS